MSAEIVAVAVAALAFGVLIWHAPAYGLLAGIFLVGIEGSLKLSLAAAEFPFSASPNAVGAGFIDFVLFAAIAVLVVRDRGDKPRRVWAAASRWERGVIAAVLGWLTVSVIQIPLSDDPVLGLMGFRLTHAYTAAAVGGLILLWPGTCRDALLTTLLAILGAISAYAAIRAIVGPTEPQRIVALVRTYSALYDDVFRAVGSFSSSVGMTSFVAPAGLFAAGIGLLRPRYRMFGVAIAACALVALIGSYGRTPLVAFGIGIAIMAGYVVATGALAKRTKRVLVVSVVGVLVLGATATAIAGSASPTVADRTRGILQPLGDQAIEERFALWSAMIDGVADRPLGVGLGRLGSASGTTIETRTTADNSYLKVLVEQGVLGALLFMVGVAGITIVVARRLSGGSGGGWAVGVAGLSAFTVFLLLMLTGETVELPGKVVAWTLLGGATAQAFSAGDPARRSRTS